MNPTASVPPSAPSDDEPVSVPEESPPEPEDPKTGATRRRRGRGSRKGKGRKTRKGKGKKRAPRRR